MSVPHGVQTPSEGKPPRRFARQRIETLVYAELGPENGGFPINISREGMAFMGVRPLEANQTVNITFKLPGIGQPISGTAAIVWLNESQKGGGLRFVDFPDDSRTLIDRWLSSRGQPAIPNEKAADPISRSETKTFPQTTEDPPASIYASSSTEVIGISSPILDSSTSTSDVAAFATVSNFSPQTPPLVTDGISILGLLNSGDMVQPSRIPTSLARGSKKNELIMSFALGVIFTFGIIITCGVIVWEFRGSLLPLIVTGYSAQPAIRAVQAPILTPPAEQAAVVEPQPAPTITESAGLPPTTNDPGDHRTQPLPNVTQKDPGSTTEALPSTDPRMVTSKSSSVSAAPPEESRPRVVAMVPSQVAPAAPPPVNLMPELATDHVNEALSLGTARAPSPPITGKLSETRANLTPSIEIIPDPYPSIRVPPESAGRTARAGTSFTIGRVISQVQPQYPTDALQQRISGTVKLHVVIDRHGKVERAEITEGPASLGDAALRAVRQWLYEPAVLGSTPIEAEQNITMTFRLASSTAPAN